MVADLVAAMVVVSCWLGSGVAIAAPAFTPAMANLAEPAVQTGGCTGSLQSALRDGEAAGHDHGDAAAHRLLCAMEVADHVDLADALAAVPDAVLGDMDRVGATLAVTVQYPEAGVLVFDVADPTHPVLRAFHRSGLRCSTLAADVACGTTVSLADDGRTAFLALRHDGMVPGDRRPYEFTPGVFPAIEEIDLTTGASRVVAAQSFGGMAALQAFSVPAGPSSPGRPREPGAYLAYALYGRGVFVRRGGAEQVATQVSGIDADDMSGMEVQHDPLTGRTLLYVLQGFDSVFTVFDVTAPSAPRALGEWDPTPQCEEDWYARTIDVRVAGSRRVAAVGLAGVDWLGEQGTTDQSEGCGELVGNGDYASPVMLVDITDFDRLGTPDLSDGDDAEAASDMRPRSERAYITAWANPVGEPARDGRFATAGLHFIDDDRLLVAWAHGGVTVLDVSDGMAGRNARPRELAAATTAPGTPRPLPRSPRGEASFATLLGPRPYVFDALPAGPGDALWAADGSGGLSTLRLLPPKPVRTAVPSPTPVSSPCKDVTPPATRLRVLRISRRLVSLRGTAADKGCHGPAGPIAGDVGAVQVAVARQVSRRSCRFLSARGRPGRKRSCAKPVYLRAHGTASWRLAIRPRAPLARGRYIVFARAADAAGNVERPTRRARNVRRVELR